jgi:hypothetical protein
VTPHTARCLLEDFQAEQNDEVEPEASGRQEAEQEVDNDIGGDTGSGVDQDSDEDVGRLVQEVLPQMGFNN